MPFTMVCSTLPRAWQHACSHPELVKAACALPHLNKRNRFVAYGSRRKSFSIKHAYSSNSSRFLGFLRIDISKPSSSRVKVIVWLRVSIFVTSPDPGAQASWVGPAVSRNALA